MSLRARPPETGGHENPVLSWLKLNKFYETTPISGFTLIVNSKFQWERLTWYVLIVLFTILTVQNVKEVFDEYMESKVVTVVTVRDVDNRIENRFGIDDLFEYQVMVTIPTVFFFTDSLKEYYRGTKDPKNLLEKAFFDPNADNSGEWELIANKTLEEYDQFLMEESKSLVNEHWSLEMLFSFLVILNQEGWTNYHKKNTMSRYFHHLSGYLAYFPEIQHKFEKVLEAEHLFDDGTLYNKFIEEFVNQILLYERNRRKVELVYTTFDEPGETIFCIFNVRNTTSPYQKFTVKLSDKNNMLSSNVRQMAQISITDERTRYRNLGEATAGQKITVTLEPISFWETASCNESHRLLNCRYACFMHSFQESKGCILPNSYAVLLDGGADAWCPYSYIKTHIDDEKFNNKIQTECQDECEQHQVCNRTTYLTAVAQTPDVIDNLDAYSGVFISLRLEIIDKVLTVIFFEEQQKTSFYSFLAEAGGSMDLWIGASVIGFVHLIMYLIKQTVYIFSRKTKTGGKLRSMFRDTGSTAVAPAAIAVERAVAKLSTMQKMHQLKMSTAEVCKGPQEELMQEMLEIIEEQQKEIEKQERTIEKQEVKFEKQQEEIEKQWGRFEEQQNKIEEQWKKFEERMTELGKQQTEDEEVQPE